MYSRGFCCFQLVLTSHTAGEKILSTCSLTTYSIQMPILSTGRRVRTVKEAAGRRSSPMIHKQHDLSSLFILCLFPHRIDVKTKWGNTCTTLGVGTGSYYHMKKLQSCTWVKAHILPNDLITPDPWHTLPCSKSYADTDREKRLWADRWTGPTAVQDGPHPEQDAYLRYVIIT